MYIKFENRPSVLSYYAVAGRKEKEGPIGHLIEEFSDDDRFFKDTWEKATNSVFPYSLGCGVAKEIRRREANPDQTCYSFLLFLMGSSLYHIKNRRIRHECECRMNRRLRKNWACVFEGQMVTLTHLYSFF